ncbi:MAG: NAD(+)/NADH kinase [Candidatus Moraniibacteriota bacterium]
MTQKRDGFVIVANTGKPLAMRVKEEMTQWLIAQGQSVIGENDPLKMLARYVIALGGDGTAIRTVTEYSIYGVIMIPINIDGGVGFVTIGNMKNWKSVLGKIIKGECVAEKRIGLELLYRGVTYGPYANDVVLKHTASIVTLKMLVNNHVVYRGMTADGLIIAAPTGSTGYSVSAGGTIALPGTECIFVTPMYPDQLNVKPLVMTSNSIITMEVVGAKPSGVVNLIADGKIIGNVDVGEKIIVRQHETKLLFAITDNNEFYRALQTKKGLAR